MAARKPKPAPVTEADLDFLKQEETYLDDVSARLTEFFQTQGIDERPDVRITVNKLEKDPKTGEITKWQVYSGDDQNFDLRAVAKMHGSGHYRVSVFIKNDDGKMPLRGSPVVSIKLTPQEEKELEAAKRADYAANTTKPENSVTRDIDIADIVAKAAEATAKSLIAVLPKPVDPLQQMAAFTSLARAMQPASAPVDSGFNNVKGMMELFSFFKMMQGGNEIPRGATGDDLMVGLVNQFGPLLKTALEKRVSPEPPTTPTAPASLDALEQQKMSMLVSEIMSDAAAGKPHDRAVELLLKHAPDELHEALVSMSPADLVGQLSGLIPQAAGYTMWLTAMINAYREAYEHPELAETESMTGQEETETGKLTG